MLARRSGAHGRGITAAEPGLRCFQRVPAELVGLGLAHLRAVEGQRTLGQVHRGHLERGDFTDAQTMIQQQTQQQGVTPPLVCVRLAA